MDTVSTPIRLDKWLWAARLYKTRAASREHIVGGKVHYNGQRTKPSKSVEIGATISIRQGTTQKQVIVTELCVKRQNAEQAQCLYRETEQSQLEREKRAQQRRLGHLIVIHPVRRPTKKERRHLIEFKKITKLCQEKI